MENQPQQQQQEAIILQDTLNDEYWQKKYGVSANELRENGEIGLQAKIVQANSKNKVYAA
jgi:hypothetical protein